MQYYYHIAESLTTHLSLWVRFILPFCVFMMLISIHLFKLKELPLAIPCKADLVVLNCLSLCSGKVFVPPSFLKGSFLGIILLVDSYFLSIFRLHHPILFWLEKFLLRNLPTVLWGFPCMYVTSLFCLATIKILSFSLTLDCWIIMCLCVALLALMNLDVYIIPQVWEVYIIS